MKKNSLDQDQYLTSSVTLNEPTSRAQQRTQSLLFNKYDPQSSLKGSLYTNPTQSNLLLPQVNFIGEEEFKKNPDCFVCGIPFGSLKDRQHHCRLCGNSCCSLCSTRTINSQRVCDVCFFKATQITYERKRKAYIKSLKQHIEKMTGLLNQENNRIVQLDQEATLQEAKAKEETAQLAKTLGEQQSILVFEEKEKKILQQELLKMKLELEEKNKLREKLLIQEQEVDQRLRMVETDIYLKEQKLEEKQQQLQQLQKHKAELESSESFVKLNQSQKTQTSVNRASMLYDQRYLDRTDEYFKEEELSQKKQRNNNTNQEDFCKSECSIY